MSTADIGRVEVLRGSQSALYGASAVGGVINITTRSAEQEGTTQSAAVEAGSHETFNTRYSFTSRGPDGQVSATLSHVTTGGFSAASAGDEADGFDATRLSFSARHRLSERLSVGASAFVQGSRSEYDDWPDDADFVEHRDELGARLFAEYEAGAATHEFELTGYRVDREDDSADFLGNPVTDEFEGNRVMARYLGSAPVNDGLTLSWGAEIGRETVEAPDFDTQRETTRGIFAEAQWAPRGDLDISASARLDDHSDFDTHSTARLAAAWRPSEALTLRGAVSNGYRVPAAAERFGPFGNPDLEAETSRSGEIGAEYAFTGGAAISGTAFWLETDDEVTFGPPPTYTPANIERTLRHGVELAGTLPLGERATLDAAYTYLDAEVTGGPNSGDRLLRVPRHDLSLSLGADVNARLSGTFTVQHVADRHDVRTDFSRGPVHDYTVAHAKFTYAMSDTADLTLRIENVLDERYERVAGYGTSGRAVYLGLSSRF
ncbi:hypothetical protein C2I36_14385 [Rhodobacteraceae bacterium WD3A24]|nr:hypothetical protein C2I36_14385 [Rhodobacteraceae bacterium WD3A24]